MPNVQVISNTTSFSIGSKIILIIATIIIDEDCIIIISRVYRPAKGGERACNSRTSCIEGEMLAVTKFKSKSDML